MAQGLGRKELIRCLILITLGALVGLVAAHRRSGATPAQPPLTATPAPVAAPPHTASPMMTVARQAAEPAPSETIGEGELLSVSITNLAGPNVETVKTCRLTGDGVIALPSLKNRVKAVSLTLRELEQAIAQAYHDQGVTAQLQVAVMKLEQ